MKTAAPRLALLIVAVALMTLAAPAQGGADVTGTLPVASKAGTDAPAAEGRGTVEGRVTYQDGAPAARARVALTVRTEVNARRPPTAKQAVASADGRFQINDVPPGEYDVAAGDGSATARGRTYVSAGATAHVHLALNAPSRARRSNGAAPARAGGGQGGKAGNISDSPTERRSAITRTRPGTRRKGGTPLPRNDQPLPRHGRGR